jgi:hypothetical protein
MEKEERKFFPFQCCQISQRVFLRFPDFEFCLLARIRYRKNELWSINTMIVTRENRNKARETCLSDSLSTTNLKRIEAGTKTNLYGEKPM